MQSLDAHDSAGRKRISVKEHAVVFVLLTLSLLSFVYFLLMQIFSPGTFAGTFLSFSAVWLYLAVFLAFLAALEKKLTLRTVWLRIKKPFRIAICSVIGAGIVVSVVNLAVILTPKVSSGAEDVRYVILLGGGVTKDAKLTKSVQMRVERAAEYLKAHPSAIAVVTGGQGTFSPCPESDVLKPELEKCGIDGARILAEDKAKDTIQNFLFSARLFASHDEVSVEDILSSPVAVVTSSFHLARAERLAVRMGFTDIYGVSSKIPALFSLNSYTREICAYIKLSLRIILTGKPDRITAYE